MPNWLDRLVGGRRESTSSSKSAGSSSAADRRSGRTPTPSASPSHNLHPGSNAPSGSASGRLSPAGYAAATGGRRESNSNRSNLSSRSNLDGNGSGSGGSDRGRQSSFAASAAAAAAAGLTGPERVIDENTDMSTLTDTEIMRLMEGMDGSTLGKPLITGPVPLLAIRAEYLRGAPQVLRKLEWLEENGWDQVWRARGDGDCFYRSFTLAYLLRILYAPERDTAAAIALTQIHSTMPGMERVGFQQDLVEEFLEPLLSTVTSFMDPPAGAEPSEFSLLQILQDAEKSNCIVVALRLMTGAYIRTHPDAFAPFLFSPNTLEPISPDAFCREEVEPCGKEADHAQITALASALAVPVRVAYLDRSELGGDDVINWVEFGEHHGEDGVGGHPLTLLYRPGHFDVVTKDHIQSKLRSQGLAQPSQASSSTAAATGQAPLAEPTPTPTRTQPAAAQPAHAPQAVSVPAPTPAAAAQPRVAETSTTSTSGTSSSPPPPAPGAVPMPPDAPPNTSIPRTAPVAAPTSTAAPVAAPVAPPAAGPTAAPTAPTAPTAAPTAGIVPPPATANNPFTAPPPTITAAPTTAAMPQVPPGPWPAARPAPPAAPTATAATPTTTAAAPAHVSEAAVVPPATTTTTSDGPTRTDDEDVVMAENDTRTE